MSWPASPSRRLACSAYLPPATGRSPPPRPVAAPPPAVLDNKGEHLRIDADSKRRRSATRFRGHPRAGTYRFVCVRKRSLPSRFEPYRRRRCARFAPAVLGYRDRRLSNNVWRDFGAMRPRVLCAGAGHRARAAGVRVRAPVIRTRSPRTCTVTEAGGSTRRAVRPRHRLSLIHDPDHRPDVTGIHPAVHRHELATRGRQDPGNPHGRIRHEPSPSPPTSFWRRRHGRPAAASSEPAQ